MAIQGSPIPRATRRRIVRMYRKGKTWREIMEKCNVSRGTIAKFTEEAGVGRRNCVWDESDAVLVLDMRRRGLAWREVAEVMGCTPEAARALVRHYAQASDAIEALRADSSTRAGRPSNPRGPR